MCIHDATFRCYAITIHAVYKYTRFVYTVHFTFIIKLGIPDFNFGATKCIRKCIREGGVTTKQHLKAILCTE